MKTVRFLIIAISAFVILSVSNTSEVKAQEIAFYDTAAVLEQFCTSRYDTDYGYCAGYITSVADILLQYELYGYSACFSSAIKSQQLIDNVVAFLKDNPNDVTLPAKEVVAKALATAFPCQR